MEDLLMLFILAASYLLFAGFLKWCGSVIREKEGTRG